MKKNRLWLVLIFLNVQCFVSFAQEHGADKAKKNNSDAAAQPGGLLQLRSVDDEESIMGLQKLYDMSSCPPEELAKRKGLLKEWKACKEKEEKEKCTDALSGYRDMLEKVAEGCAGSGLSGSDCIERARACVGAQGINPMQSLMGASAVSNICSTKAANDANRESEEKQNERMDEAKKDMSDRYREAQTMLNDVNSEMYDVLSQISDVNKEMKDRGVTVPSQVQAVERGMRRKLMASREEYFSLQEQLALLNKEILRTNTKIGELPNGFMESCQRQYRDDYEEAKLQQVQLSKSLQGQLKEVSTSSTIQSYDIGLKEAKKDYALAKKALESKIKNSYMDCLADKQKEYKSQYENMQRQLESQQASKTAIEKKIQSHLVNMNADLEEGRSEIDQTLKLGQNDQEYSRNKIELMRASFNGRMNAAQQAVASAAQEMQSFQQQFQTQQQYKMMSGMLTMLTSQGQGSLGDVLPYIERYDEYKEDKESKCPKASSTSGGYNGPRGNQ